MQTKKHNAKNSVTQTKKHDANKKAQRKQRVTQTKDTTQTENDNADKNV